MWSEMAIFALGFLAQLFFFSRMLVQWIMSEREKRIVSPDFFWLCSLIGSILFFLYGWLREDFSIILGQFISYFIYIWNLDLKGIWSRWPILIRALILLLPFVAVYKMTSEAELFAQNFFHNSHIPLWLLIFGSMGQIIFSVRFLYQWIYSMRQGESILPIGFWIISLVGSGIIVIYACIRLDPVLILSQLGGFITYTRNIILGMRHNREERKKELPQKGS
ncbi:MAG: lipid-A-disaccharide synthase N-terminal domain-containing protein [Bacteroidaceae bacterium]|nr:lipid-A-disaccharide synthase N-terminal domain-containing protein [Bacteroidaceae bacterium]